jgi:hypothetical protein
LVSAGADAFQASVDFQLPSGAQQRWSIREDSLVWLNP